MSWLSDFIGDITGSNAREDAARVQRDYGEQNIELVRDLADQNDRLIRETTDQQTIRSQPFLDAGYDALALQKSVLGVPTSVRPSVPLLTDPGASASSPPQQQTGQQPIPSNIFARGGWQGLRDAPRTDAGGAVAGKTAPINELTSQISYARPASQAEPMTPATTQGAYNIFKDSGFAKANLETTAAERDDILSSYGAAGKLVSGASLTALNDHNRRRTGNAFADWYNSLGGMSGAGQTAGREINQATGAAGANIANSNAGATGAITGQNNVIAGALADGTTTGQASNFLFRAGANMAGAGGWGF